MNNRLRFRALNAESINVAHNVMADKLFPLLGNVIVNIVLVRFHFGNLLIGNAEAELLFRSCKGNPQPPPCSEFEVLRKNVLHLVACISC